MGTSEDKYSGRERRRYPRVRAAFAEYSPIGAEEATSKGISTFIKNVSAGGVCIVVSQEIEVNSILSLKIYLSQSESSIQAKGKVVWSKTSSFRGGVRAYYDLGIEFVEIDENDRMRICKYISQHPGEIQS